MIPIFSEVKILKLILGCNSDYRFVSKTLEKVIKRILTISGNGFGSYETSSARAKVFFY